MSSVFVGGSRRLGRLNEQIRQRLDSIIEKNFMVFIGDANGTDKAIQRYLAECGYRNVIVYCMEGAYRNNVGNWEIRDISADASKGGWEYFAAKDAAMAKDASYGFMIWDGKSKGTLNNLLNLVENGKTVLLYFSPEKKFRTIRARQDIGGLLSQCDEKTRKKLAEQLDFEQQVGPIQAGLPL